MAPTALVGAEFSSQHTLSSQPPLTSVPGDLVPSLSTCISVNIPTHIDIIKIKTPLNWKDVFAEPSKLKVMKIKC